MCMLHIFRLYNLQMKIKKLRKMEANPTQKENNEYVLMCEASTNQKYEIIRYTLPKLTFFTLAVLNVVSSLSIIGVCLVYLGSSSIIFAFYGTRRDGTVFGTSVVHGVLLTATTIAWIVIMGYCIRSMIKRKRFSGPKSLKFLGMHALDTYAVWVIIIRVILGSTICALDAANIREISSSPFAVLFIELVLNVSLMTCYYWCAVKLDFGPISGETDDDRVEKNEVTVALISDKVEEKGYIEKVEVVNEKSPMISEDTTVLSPTTDKDPS